MKTENNAYFIHLPLKMMAHIGFAFKRGLMDIDPDR